MDPKQQDSFYKDTPKNSQVYLFMWSRAAEVYMKSFRAVRCVAQ